MAVAIGLLTFHFVQTGFKTFGMALWITSPYIRVEKEELLYTWQSLVAEFGGTLGLFLGFSFIAVWDWIQDLGRLVKKFELK